MPKVSLTTLAILLIGGLSLGTAMLSAPASARQMSNGSWQTKTTLKSAKFKCEVVSLGFIICTKGDKTYWCSGWKCVEMKSGQKFQRRKAVEPGRVKNPRYSRRSRNVRKYIGETEKKLSGPMFRKFRNR